MTDLLTTYGDTRVSDIVAGFHERRRILQERSHMLQIDFDEAIEQVNHDRAIGLEHQINEAEDNARECDDYVRLLGLVLAHFEEVENAA